MTKFINITKVNVAVGQLPLDVCQRISAKVKTIKSTDSGTDFNLWDHTVGDDDFELLKSEFVKVANDLVQADSNTVDQVQIARAWPISYKDYESHAPHHHGGTFVVGVAYIDVSDDSGDLLVQDPLSAHFWVNHNDKRTFGSCRASVPITPEPGMIVVMPGYLVHSTEPKPLGKKRLIIATNFDN